MMKGFKLLPSSFGKAALAFSLVCASGIVPTTFTLSAVAQQRGPVQRIVEGKVTNGSSGVVKGAVVYLKNGQSVKSFIANDQGQYRFGQLAQNTDYEIWAEEDGKKSSVKTISSFDSKNHFYIDLKIDTGK
ncbi:carboxypeptidase regulatory-like domain-containing protein [Edaphobacter sp. HDX4]|uniref:carboxypeptidase-like regulatory domain-containing protein n=1 Tax=Edaphobacter sp. HDX4 TaxID=2794064 RepID=UPI002FE55C70